MPNKPKLNCTHGFTLLEVLVALAVLAIGLGASIKLAAQGVENFATLRDRTLAGWVASNRVNAILLESTWPALGRSNGQTTLANRRWHWQLQVSATSDTDLRRLDISVSAADSDRMIATELVAQTALMGRPR